METEYAGGVWEWHGLQLASPHHAISSYPHQATLAKVPSVTAVCEVL